MRENNNNEQNVLEMVLLEPSNERTFFGATLDNLTDVDVMIALLRFYIKIGFSHDFAQFKVGDIKLTYLANGNDIIVDIGDDPSYTVKCEQWGAEA